MTEKLRPGQKVRVYQRPLTSEDFEGEARIVTVLTTDEQPSAPDGGVSCLVEFCMDGDRVVRRIMPKQKAN